MDEGAEYGKVGVECSTKHGVDFNCWDDYAAFRRSLKLTGSRMCC